VQISTFVTADSVHNAHPSSSPHIKQALNVTSDGLLSHSSGVSSIYIGLSHFMHSVAKFVAVYPA